MPAESDAAGNWTDQAAAAACHCPGAACRRPETVTLQRDYVVGTVTYRCPEAAGGRVHGHPMAPLVTEGVGVAACCPNEASDHAAGQTRMPHTI